MNKALHTDNAPAAIGPYSQAVQAEKTIYVSGQLPVDLRQENLLEKTLRHRQNRALQTSRTSLHLQEQI